MSLRLGNTIVAGVLADTSAFATKTELSGKADVDLSNINPSASAKETIVGLGMPDYSAGITLSSSSFPYTAPVSGFLYQAATNCQMAVNGHECIYNGSAGGDGAFVAKGDIVTIITGSFVRCYFYPLKGVSNA